MEADRVAILEQSEEHAHISSLLLSTWRGLEAPSHIFSFVSCVRSMESPTVEARILSWNYQQGKTHCHDFHLHHEGHLKGD